MSNANTTLTSLWIDDGSPTKLVVTGTKPELREDFERFFKEVDGLEPLARQAGLLDANGDILLGQTSDAVVHTQPANSQGVQFVYITSPAKQILPKTEPMVVQTNQAPVHVQRVHSYTSNPHLKRAADTHTITVDALDSKRPRKAEKGGKGLRHFSMKVCEKVEAKGITTYNEVAEELVDEFTDPRNAQSEQAQYDQKNIRRRVYDALNVLMAMNIISKEKKEIRWIGLPTNSAQEYQSLEVEKANRLERIKQKEQKLQELVIQQIAYKNLVNRNSQLEKLHGVPPENSKIQLPFVIVNTNKKTVIDCSISHDKYEYLFNFDNTFEIHDDIEVLKRMGLTFGLEKGVCSREDMEKAVDMLPKSLESYVRRICPTNKPTSAAAATSSTSGLLTIKPSSVSTQPTYIQVPIGYQQ